MASDVSLKHFFHSLHMRWAVFLHWGGIMLTVMCHISLWCATVATLGKVSIPHHPQITFSSQYHYATIHLSEVLLKVHPLPKAHCPKHPKIPVTPWVPPFPISSVKIKEPQLFSIKEWIGEIWKLTNLTKMAPLPLPLPLNGLGWLGWLLGHCGASITQCQTEALMSHESFISWSHWLVPLLKWKGMGSKGDWCPIHGCPCYPQAPVQDPTRQDSGKPLSSARVYLTIILLFVQWQLFD